MVDNNQDMQDNREFFRLIYLDDERPKLTIGRRRFQVIDISMGGLRFLNAKEVELQDYVKGRLKLSCGEIVPVEGAIEWKQGTEYGLLLKEPLSATAIEKERLFVRH